ncbi:unnamed protein product (macronuclear) [Paramecium tetraurelia]|uniref:ubiquitinyl hydrolase 1 n=1 Tax=Paramecium tetraurelia TaxID=5888 RepID=A0C185_PARTE|nr:uncharacterized protein GSPATT00034028001 [Paramecium tetraurelia]CAK64552.1 unnamed protein product [Paramecium tetraurelia]|eukprot:XP_001431950.1 hypothetical protein (macronuclear) [Paramecium tetraurelia strain d4-2]
MLDGMFEAVDEEYNPTTTVYQTRRAQNCADQMDLPEYPRVKHFAGLKNQGATCYLNSLIQSYYMSPEFRKVILSLPLCGETIEDSANFAKNESRNRFLLEFQKLFIQLQSLQSKATSTLALTSSFGWNDGQQMQQQDVSDANKVLFETLDRSLYGTPFIIAPFYKGVVFHHITCLNCNNSHGNEEIMYDFNIQVEGNKNLSEGLFSYINPFLLDGNNQYLCELCGFKVDALKGDKIRKLPSILTITLNRYTFDYERMQRVKLNDRFEFPLEIEMGVYLENPVDNLVYELQGVIIHRGNAHGGHYFAYFRDLLDEGDWLSHIPEYWQEKEESQQQQKKKNDEEVDYDEVKLPFEISNPKVAQGWFDFNDNTVIPIPVNKIQSQYQGSESAYILIYRDRNLVPSKLSNEEIPKYLNDYVNKLNEKIEQDRQAYEEAKQHITITVADASVVDLQNHKLLNDNYEKVTYKLKLSSTIQQLYEQIKKDEYWLLEFKENYQNKLLHFPRYLKNPESTLEEEKVEHESTWILVRRDQDLLQVGLKKIPIKLNLLINKQPQSFLLYLSTTLLELKQLVFALSGIPENEQELRNVQNQKIVSDLSDETLLEELQLTLESQILVKKKAPIQDVNKNEKDLQGGEDIISILVEQEDKNGVSKFYVNINQTIQDLIEFIKEQFGITDAYRLRNLNGSILFCKTDLPIQLKEFQSFREGGARLQIEKGEVPETGKISIVIQNKEQNIEIHVDPRSDKIEQLKLESCKSFNLDPAQYRLYKVDWLQVPSEGLTDETKTVSQCYLRDRDLLILCDKTAQIDCELVRFQLYSTTTGYPDDCVFQKHETMRKDATLKDLKQMIISTFGLNVDVDHLRVRDINKNRFFGQVFRKLELPIQKCQFSTNDIVYQVLNQPEYLKDDEMLLLIKERDPLNKVYIKQQEFVFKVSKTPTLNELKEQIQKFVGIEEGAELQLAKFIIQEFQWLHIDSNALQKQAQGKNKGKGKQGKQENQNNKQPQKGQKQQQQQDPCDNLKKSPFNLGEGDFIGYRFGNHPNDDFQTKEDNELRERMIAARKNKHNALGPFRRQQEQGFIVDIE